MWEKVDPLLLSDLSSSAGVQKRANKMTAIWKVDSNWASL